jgi:LysR family hydrogen peroxide-inducible transcriptional activator
MVWRKSSAISAFLKTLAGVVSSVPRELLDARADAPAQAARARKRMAPSPPR